MFQLRPLRTQAHRRRQHPVRNRTNLPQAGQHERRTSQPGRDPGHDRSRPIPIVGRVSHEEIQATGTQGPDEWTRQDRVPEPKGSHPRRHLRRHRFSRVQTACVRSA